MIKAATIIQYAERFVELTKRAEAEPSEVAVPSKAYDMVSALINKGSFENAYDLILKLNHLGYKLKSNEFEVPYTQLLEFERFVRGIDN